MSRFQIQLNEAAASEEKLTHLEHNEDHVLHGGVEGFNHAVNNLTALHDKMLGKDNGVDVQVKHDGSPSIVFGRHPENGKFFVSSKSGFNKTPKINYTPDDVEKNHGHAPGLVSKLKAALKHLPKIAPEKGVYQGDLMYARNNKDDDDVYQANGKHHFKPNTITYSTPSDSEEGKKIDKAKVGVLVHTGYDGSTFAGMKANFTPDKSVFKQHNDVHQFSNEHDFGSMKYSPEHQAEFMTHMKAAEKAYRSTAADAFDHTLPHEEHLKTYINQTVKDGSDPHVAGFKQHVADKWNKTTSKLKTDKAVQMRNQQLQAIHDHVDQHTGHFEDTLALHGHLMKAKQPLLNALATHQRYEHTIGGEPTKPEGYVVVRNGRPSKIVDRADFSRKNFEVSANR